MIKAIKTIIIGVNSIENNTIKFTDSLTIGHINPPYLLYSQQDKQNHI